MGNAYKYFVGNVMGEKAVKSTFTAEDNIKSNVMEIWHDNVHSPTDTVNGPQKAAMNPVRVN